MAGQAPSGFALSAVAEGSRSSSSSASRAFSRADAFQNDDEEEDRFQHLRSNGNSHQKQRPNGKASQDEMLTGYSRERGAEKLRRSPPQRGPLVIPRQADMNWMEERKRRLGLEKYRSQLGSLSSMRNPNNISTGSIPLEAKVEASGPEKIGDEEQKSGLQIRRKELSRGEEELRGIAKLQEDGRDAENMALDGDETPNASQAGTSPVEVKGKEEREDEEARLALLGGQGFGSALTQVDKIIPISEEEALQRDTESRPEPPTMSDYSRMPVEEFGAALLRGMGWKEGMGAGKDRQGPTTAPKVQKRAALLGLGAKERETADNDTQSGPRAKNFRIDRPERRYVPVLRRERDGNISKDVSASASSSPAPSRHHRDRSRSPSLKRRESDRSPEYKSERHHRTRREYDVQYDRERGHRKGDDRERERDRDRFMERSTDKDRRHEDRRRQYR